MGSVHKKVLNCFKSTLSEFKNVTVTPLKDAVSALKISEETASKLTIIGVWLFADSDNSKSETLAYLKDLQLEY